MAFSLNMPPEKITPERHITTAYQNWLNHLNSNNYDDTHCWTFTPSSFALIFLDLNYLGIIDLNIKEISETNNFEFFVHLSKNQTFNKDSYFEAREILMKKITCELSANAQNFLKLSDNKKSFFKVCKNLLK
jgi:hypothetical protein